MEPKYYFNMSIQDGFRAQRLPNQDEIDQLLDKISAQGHCLVPIDRVKLDEFTGHSTVASEVFLSKFEKALRYLEKVINQLDVFTENGVTYLNCDRIGGFATIKPKSVHGKVLEVNPQLMWVLRFKFKMTIFGASQVFIKWVEEYVGVNNVILVEPMEIQGK